MAEYRYPLDNAWERARERLRQLEIVWDPWTLRNLSKLGVRAGWECLEVAAGGGSIAAWLCAQVGPEGHVLATDLEPRLLEAIASPNLRVERHNILDDHLPEAAFDLVHTRALLTFLPEPQKAIEKMAAAVKPGGWLLIEEPDYASVVPDPCMKPHAVALSCKGWEALLCCLTSKGYDTEFGRHLYSDLHRAGLLDVQSEGWTGIQLGGTSSARFWRITLEQLQEHALAAGLLTETELREFCSLLESPEYRWLNLTMMSSWGRRAPDGIAHSS